MTSSAPQDHSVDVSYQAPPGRSAEPDERPPGEVAAIDVTDQVWLKLVNDVESTDLQKTLALTASGLTGTAAQGIHESVASLIGCELGRFRLEKEIARGGTGIIMQSRDLELDREVAIKLLLKTHLDKPLLKQQFMHEARITGRLQHPGIIPIYQTGTMADGRPYFVMKLVDGQTLAALLAERNQPDKDLPRLLKVFEQVCQTLSYTHSHGVIHFDIKPANVMVGTFGEVHLMDWGLARPSRESDSGPDQADVSSLISAVQSTDKLKLHDLATPLLKGTVSGTPAYMAPEQARGQDVSVRTDVFGLGAILCEILTGCCPYSGTKLVDVCYQAASGDLEFAYAKLAECDADDVLVRLAIRCLSPTPEDRPADAGVVARELTLYLESLLQRAESDLERFFELSLDLFCIAGFDGYFRRVNSNFPRVLGYEEKTLVSRPFIEFVHPDDREQTRNVMLQLAKGKPVVQFRNRYSAADGTWRCLEWTAKSIRKDEIIFAVARDVTGQNR